MGTIVVYAIIAIAVAAAIVALLVLVLPNETLSRAPADVVPLGLPVDREVAAEDLDRMRLPVTMRGYRMVDADAVFDRLSAEIARRDQEISELRHAAAHEVLRPDLAAPTDNDRSSAASTGGSAETEDGAE